MEHTAIGLDNVGMPFSLDAEQAVLGSVILDGSCMEQVMVHLKPDHFYLPQHRALYAAMVNMYTNSTSIDVVTLLEAMRSESIYDEAGSKTYIYQLAQIVPSIANVETYAKIVREKYYIRALITASKEIIDSASDGQADANLLLDAAEQRIYNIRQGKEIAGPMLLKNIIVGDVYDHLHKITGPDREQYLGTPMGLSELDRMTTGLNKSDLIIVGARPGMGKTSFALCIARNVSLQSRKKVVFFSLEMNKDQIAQRVLAAEAGISSAKMRSGELDGDDWVKLAKAAGVLAECNLYFDDTTNITVPEMKARVRRMKDVDLIIIDYLQLMKTGTKSDNRVQEVSEITRSLKLMAKDLNIPVITCAQLSRNTESRGKSHKPQLADLRESGSIEQDADIVMMLYRNDYYNADMEEEIDEVDRNTAEVILAKNRHGEVGSVLLHWEPQFTRFTTRERLHHEF